MKQFLKNALSTGLPFGVAMGLYFAWQYGAFIGLAAGVGSGICFGIGMAVFQANARGKLEVTEGDVDGEPIVRQGRANHRLNGEHRGGWLVLTKRRLLFTSHGANLQNASVDIPVADINSVTPARSLGIIPNRLVVEHFGGSKELFTVSDRDEWLDRLGELKEPSEGVPPTAG